MSKVSAQFLFPQGDPVTAHDTVSELPRFLEAPIYCFDNLIKRQIQAVLQKINTVYS